MEYVGVIVVTGEADVETVFVTRGEFVVVI
jgi:hypothetical protein